MGEDQKSIDGVMEKLALITDAAQTLFPNSKSVIVFELNYQDFKKVQDNFREVDRGHNQFKVDLSGVEIIFILEGVIKIEEPKKKKPNLLSRLRFLISGEFTVKD